MAIFYIDSSSASNLVISKSFIASSSIQFVTTSLYIDNGLGQGGGVNFNLIMTGSSSSGSHAEGLNNKATGFYSHAEGIQTTSSNGGGHVEGYKNVQIAQSHIEGYSNTGSGGTYSHTEGEANFNSRGSTHVEGYKNNGGTSVFTPYAGHIEGYSNSVPGTESAYFHIEGELNTGSRTAAGTDCSYSHIEGYGNNGLFASIAPTHVEGSGSYLGAGSAGGYGDAHIEGGGHNLRPSAPATAYLSAHLEGFNNSVRTITYTFLIGQAGGRFSHVGGANNNLYGSLYSRVSGIDNNIFCPPFMLNPQNSQSMASIQAIGRGLKLYNTASKYAMFLGHYNTSLLTGSNYIPNTGYIVIGGGVSDSNRANIMEIYDPATTNANYIVLPGLQFFNNHSEALAAGVPVGGLYRSYDSFNGTNNNISIVT